MSPDTQGLGGPPQPPAQARRVPLPQHAEPHIGDVALGEKPGIAGSDAFIKIYAGMFQGFAQGQAHLYGRQAMGIGQTDPLSHPRMRAVGPDDDLGFYAGHSACGRGQHDATALPAFTAKNAVPQKHMRPGIRSGAGQCLIELVPVDDITRSRHVLNAVAVQITAHAKRGLGDIVLAHVSLAHQHGRYVFGAAHGHAHRAAALHKGHGSSGLRGGSGGAGTGGASAHNQHVIVQHASPPLFLRQPLRGA